MLQFRAEQLGSAILELQYSNFCGVAHVETLSHALDLKYSRILVFSNGEITYGGLHLPEPNDISQRLGQKG